MVTYKLVEVTILINVYNIDTQLFWHAVILFVLKPYPIRSETP